MVKRVILSGLIGILLSSLIWPQNTTMQTFQSEAEIYDAFVAGDLSEEEYETLVNLLRSKVNLNGGDIEELLVIPGVGRNIVQTIKDLRDEKRYFIDRDDFINSYPYNYEKIKPFVKVKLPEEVEFEGDISFSTSQAYALDYEQRNDISLEMSGRNLEFEADLAQKGRENIVLENRSLTWDLKNGELEVGTFSDGWGNELLVGGYIYAPSNFELTTLADQVFYPNDYRLNGARWQSKYGNFSPGVLFSYNKYAGLSTSLLSAKSDYSWEDDKKVGVVFMRAGVASRLAPEVETYSQYGISSYFNAEVNEFELDGEVSVLNNNEWGLMSSAYRRKDKVTFRASFWNYSDKFNAMYSYGEGQNDKILVDSLTDSLGLESNLAGERGVGIATYFPILEDKLRLKSNYIFWQYKPRMIDNQEIESELKYEPWKNTYLKLSYSNEDNIDQTGSSRNRITEGTDPVEIGPGRESREYWKFTSRWYNERLYLYYNFSYKNYKEDERRVLSTYFTARSKDLDPFTLDGRLKFRDGDLNEVNGEYLELDIEQELEFSPMYYSLQYSVKDYLNTNESTEHDVKALCGLKWE